MSPEATQTAGRGYFDVPFYVNQGTWTMPMNNQLLLEAGLTLFRYQPIFGHPAPDGDTSLTSVTEQSNAINPATGQRYAPVANYRYRGVETWGPATGKTDDVMTAASYVTGANSIKFGYQYRKLDLLDKDVANSSQLGYRFNQGVPNAVSYYLPDFGRRTITKTQSFFLQDSLTRGRLTLQGALRYDRASSYAPSELNGTTSTSFLNPQPITIPRTPGVDAYNDITPRVGVAYDVFGTGKTALKFNWGKYLAYAANDNPYTSTNPGATVVRSVINRGWNASVAAGGNGDYVVNCDLLNPAANGECAAATGTAPNFGKLGSATARRSCRAERLGRASGRHAVHGHVAAGVDARLSADFSFTHRSWHGFFVTDDLNRRAGGVASHYESYTLTAPSDPRLAGGGGYPVTVFVPLTNAAPSTILMREEDIGEARSSVWDGFEFSLNSRLRNGLVAQVGTTTGRGKVDDCAVSPLYNNVAGATLTGPNPRGCNNVEPWQTTLRGLVTYTIPKVDVLVSTVLRSQPKSAITANWLVPNSMIAGALGHLPVGAPATGTTTILLTDNEHRVYADERRTQVDMRFAKIVRFGRTRTDVGVDVNNLFNTSYATGFNQTYTQGTVPGSADNLGPRPSGWATPSSLVFPRFVRLNFTVNF